MFRSSRLQHIAQQRIQLRFCQIALRHQRNQRHLQLGQIAMADMLLQQLPAWPSADDGRSDYLALR